jgi:hypothetical protein
MHGNFISIKYESAIYAKGVFLNKIYVKAYEKHESNKLSYE